MSAKKARNARLDGFSGPFFPKGIISLNSLYDSVHSSGDSLQRIGAKLDGFMDLDRATATDGYGWFWIAKFHLKAVSLNMLVAFPWSQDWGKKDDVQTDRCIAVYLTGPENTVWQASHGAGEPAKAVKAVLDHFATWFKKIADGEKGE